MELSYCAYGNGEPLVILHGLLGSSDNWHSICTQLGQSFRVLALDQRNHGRSPHSAEMNYSVMAQDVNQVLQRENMPWAHVLGHSMGGKTAMQLALSFAEKVGKLIVVDIAPRAYPPYHDKILSALLGLELAQFRTRTQVQEALAGAIPDLTLRQFLLKNLGQDDRGRLYWKIGLAEVNQSYNWLREALLSEFSFPKPALFINGERSQYLGQQDEALIRSLFPRARFQTIGGAGHWVHVERPRAFLKAVTDFLHDAEAKGSPGAANQ
jgi:pimeloyl-ACP methyl ester carboxylesterase